jgi:hypothetical protein
MVAHPLGSKKKTPKKFLERASILESYLDQKTYIQHHPILLSCPTFSKGNRAM